METFGWWVLLGSSYWVSEFTANPSFFYTVITRIYWLANERSSSYVSIFGLVFQFCKSMFFELIMYL